MTREEREFAKSRIEYLLKISSFVFDERDKEALEAAIQALSQEPCENCEVGNPCLYCKHDFEHQMCKDCIHAEIYSANAMKCVKRNEIVFADGRCSKFEKTAEQEPCTDAISRDAVCEIINDIRDCISVEGYCAIRERLKKLPPVTQKPETVTEFADRCRECGARYGRLLKQKSGKWVEIDDEPHEVWECDRCGFVIDGSGCIEPYEYRDIYKYCPNFGAKMVEPQESEKK